MSRRAAAGDSAAEERDGAEVEVQQMEMALDDDGPAASLMCLGNQYALVGDDEDANAKNPWLADLYAVPNWALLSSYFNVGIALMFLSTPVRTSSFCYMPPWWRSILVCILSTSHFAFVPACLSFYPDLSRCRTISWTT